MRDAKPEFATARIHLGVTLWTAGRKREAKAEWEAVLEHDPDNTRVPMYLRMAAEE